MGHMMVYSCAGRLDHLAHLRSLSFGLSRTCSDYRPGRVGMPWMLDNGAFSDYENERPFDGERFLNALRRIPTHHPDFIVCPDLVAQGRRSLDFSIEWRQRLDDLAYGHFRYYLAVQDGMTVLDVGHELRTGRWAGLFVGGTLKWKWRTAATWIQLAHQAGLKCHIGRTPRERDLLTAQRLGADSVDSTTWARNDRHHVLDVLRTQTRLPVPP